MILTIPTIYLSKGLSILSVGGLSGFEKLDDYFKRNPINLAKLFREENNKSILIEIDESIESLNVVNKIRDSLDIPIQMATNSFNLEFLNKVNSIEISRLFLSIDNHKIFPKSIPVIRRSELIKYNLDNYSRIMIDFENTQLDNIELKINSKISIRNSTNCTSDLIRINTIKTNIDSIYLGKEYYGTHYAGQLLWRIAEKAQFAI